MTIQTTRLLATASVAFSIFSHAASIEETEDPYAKGGNITPRIVELSPEEEAAILEDVKVPEGFEATLFAPSATANYPVYVDAAESFDCGIRTTTVALIKSQSSSNKSIRRADSSGITTDSIFYTHPTSVFTSIVMETA